MIRTLALIGLLWSLLGAGEYADCCADRNALSVVQHGGERFYAVGENRLLHLGDLPRNLPNSWRVVRHDPLFGLTLYEAAHDAWPLAFRTIKRIGEHRDRLTLLSDEGPVAVKLEHLQEGFYPARLDRPVGEGAILCAPCYAVMGLGFKSGFIESDLISHFIHFPGATFAWGDLGFRFAPETVLIAAVNPFFEDNPFQPGDRVVSIGGEQVKSPSHAQRRMFTRRPGSRTEVGVERMGRRHTFVVTVAERLGGGRYADTFLEHLGWRLDESLTIEVLVHEDVVGRGAMQVGDQLIQINNHIVEDAQTAMALLSGHEGPVKLLLSRDDFHFFIRLGEGSDSLEDSVWQ
jgi:hypothetical protein